MNTFFDLGAGSGDDIKGFYELDESHKDWSIHAFEANTDRSSKLKKRYPEITVVEAAAGTFNGTGTFYKGHNQNGSSLKRAKIGNLGKQEKVPVVDICEYIKNTCTQDDQICMVIDIEGGEYEIVDALKESGVINWIDDLYIEFHGNKLSGFDMNIENEMVEYLINKFGDNVYIYRKHQHEQFLKLNAEGL